MKSLLKKVPVLAALMAVSSHAVIADTSAPALNGMKIAVVKDAIGSQDIVDGDYAEGLTKLASSDVQAYDKAMGICVANIKLNNLDAADVACTSAIEEISSLNGRGRHAKFLKSVAYSNRAIVRYLSEDSEGALEDFTSAMLISDNDIVKDNLLTLKRIRLSAEERIVDTSLAD
ncbi:hypothetical protein ACFSJY_17135 [Thalassotalea euphylliae]|uniref:hypothetical protein n=1 Tax=Thalassotalea euphylliae TaxID=1655234 RepID=UPI0036307C4E